MAKAPGQINVGDLPEDVQQSLYQQLKKKYNSKERSISSVSKEEKLAAMAEIFRALKGLNLAQLKEVEAVTKIARCMRRHIANEFGDEYLKTLPLGSIELVAYVTYSLDEDMKNMEGRGQK
jgi:hypothetical protein